MMKRTEVGSAADSVGLPGLGTVKKKEKESDDDDDWRHLQDEARQNTGLEMEMEKLRMENKTLSGKIRGYQTLGQMLHETKDEAKKYKDLCEQLMKKADIDPNTMMSPDILGKVETTDKNVIPVKLLAEQSEVNRGAGKMTLLEVTDALVHKENENDDLTDRKPTPDDSAKNQRMQSDRPLLSSYESSNVSSNINDAFLLGLENDNLYNSSKDQELSNPEMASDISESRCIQESSHFENSEVDYGNQMESNKQFSMKVNELQGMINPQTQDLSSEILCLSLKTRQLEKKLNTRQVQIDALTKENHDLKSESAKISEKLQQKQIEHAKLLVKVRQREHERDQMSPLSDNSDWLSVEKNVKSTAGGGEEIVAVKLDETEKRVLKMEVAELKKKNKELLKVNENWDSYWRNQKSLFDKQIINLQQEVASAKLTSKGVDNEKDEHRQKEIDQMLLSTKKKLEEFEMEKEEALKEAHAEKNRCREKEHMLDEETKKRQALEDKVRHLEAQMQYAPNLAYAYPGNYAGWGSPPPHIPDQAPVQVENVQMAANMRMTNPNLMMKPEPAARSTVTSNQQPDPELLSEIEVLKQQVTIYKDDFDNERRDRERVMHEKSEMNKHFESLTGELVSTQRQLTQLKQQFDLEKKERAKKEMELNRARQATMMYPPQQVQVVLPPGANYQNYHGGMQLPAAANNWGASSAGQDAPKWACRHCTFQNPCARVYCEMCGTHKDLPKQRVAQQNSGRQVTMGGAAMGVPMQAEYQQTVMMPMQQHPRYRGPMMQYPQSRRALPSDDLVTDSGPEENG